MVKSQLQQNDPQQNKVKNNSIYHHKVRDFEPLEFKGWHGRRFLVFNTPVIELLVCMIKAFVDASPLKDPPLTNKKDDGRRGHVTTKAQVENAHEIRLDGIN